MGQTSGGQPWCELGKRRHGKLGARGARRAAMKFSWPGGADSADEHMFSGCCRACGDVMHSRYPRHGAAGSRNCCEPHFARACSELHPAGAVHSTAVYWSALSLVPWGLLSALDVRLLLMASLSLELLQQLLSPDNTARRSAEAVFDAALQQPDAVCARWATRARRLRSRACLQPSTPGTCAGACGAWPVLTILPAHDDTHRPLPP